MNIWTDAIDENGYLDPRYTCDVDNSSPELRWSDAPPETAGFVLVAEDLRSHPQVFTHWVVYNIPHELSHLPAGIPPQDVLPNGIRQGLNGHGKLGYTGPCPPRGDRSHEYVFTLYALREVPEINQRLTRAEVWRLIEPYVCAVAQIRGYYQRITARAG